MSEAEHAPREQPTYARFSNPKLHKTVSSVPINELGSSEINNLIPQMTEAVNFTDKDGTTRKVAGIAINQLEHGIDKSAVLVKITPAGEDSPKMTPVINPTISEISEGTNIDFFEGCLSCETSTHYYCAIIPRSNEVVLEGYNLQGQPIRYTLKGREARIAQHEVDHINGINIVERASKIHKVAKNKEELENYKADFQNWPEITREQAIAELNAY